MKRLTFSFGPLVIIETHKRDTFQTCMWKAMHNSGAGRLLFKEALQAEPCDLPEQPSRT